MVGRWCETFGEHRGKQLQFDTFNLYHANFWIIRPATAGYQGKGCSLVEIMAVQVQRPEWFVSHAWIEPVCQFLACLEQHALVRDLSSSACYWVCAYANNQHCVEEDIKKNPRSTSFFRAMMMSQGVLLVLDSAGTPFERIWCCFEECIAIEHREDNWSRRRLLLDVGATDFHGKAHVLTDGLAGAESRMIGILGLHRKSARERDFPLALLLRGLKVKIEEARATEKIDKVRILNSIALTRLETCDFEHLESYPTGDPNFKRVDEALASHFALASWYGFVCEGRCADELVRAVRADTGRKTVELSFTGCRNFSDHELRVLLQSLPAELRVLRLDLAFSGLETMQMFAIGGLKSLVQLKLRFTGSTEFKTAAGLGDALREMKKLTYLELWFMNLPHFEELGCLSSSLLSLRKLQLLVLDLSGCGHVPLEARMDLHQSVKRLRWRGTDLWVNIEGLPSRRWFPEVWPALVSWLRCFSRCQQMQQLGATQRGSVYATSFGKSHCSDDSEEDDERDVQQDFDENQPFPCSWPGCTSFHSCEKGYCEQHRWWGRGKTICLVVNTWRQNGELVVLVLSQAVAEVESRYLLFLIVLSLLPVASYSMSQSTGVPGTLIFLCLAFLAIASIVYTTARLNRMHELSKKLEVESEALYARNLHTEMSRFFGDHDHVRDEIIQPQITTLKEHFIQAGKEFDNFYQRLCLPLREFLEEQPSWPSSISRQELRPSLMTLPLAQAAVVRQGDPGRILDLLYCNVTFNGWDSMVSAWCFLKSRVEGDELGGIELVGVRDCFASAHAAVRCVEMIFNINSYFVTLRFLESSLTRLESQLDDVHRLADQLGLAGHVHLDPAQPGPTKKSWLLILAVFSLRVVSLFAAMYFAVQYFVRYAPRVLSSNFPQLLKDACALKETIVQPVMLEIEVSGGWLEKSLLPMLPSIFFSLPYVALMIILSWDLCRSKKLKPPKPTQLLYEEYFGLEGKFYGFKVAMLQFFTVMLQAFGKIQIMGGLVSFAFHAAPEHSKAFQGCFWAFMTFLLMNSVYPTILFIFPDVKWIRLGAAMMDAILDIAYTSTYLIISVLASYELRLDQDVSGNFGDEASVNFQAELDPAFAFPSDFLSFFAVYYSLAHVCTLFRAVERTGRKAASHSRLSPRFSGKILRRWKTLGRALYTPFLLVAIASVLLSSHFYPVDVTDFRCFPCRCWEKNDGAKHLSSCSLTGVLRFKDVSLREQGITSVATDAFKFSQPLQRLSLSKNRLGSLPRNLFAPLGNLQFLDLGSLGLQHLESDAFAGLSSLRVLSLSQNRLKVLPEDILQPMPALEQLLLGGKSTIVEGNGLSVLSKSLFKPTPWLRVLDLNRNAIASLPKGIFETTSLLRTLDLGGNNLNELHDDVFAGLHNLHSLYLNSNLLSNLSIGVFAGLTNLQTLTLSGLDRLAELPVGIFADLHNLQTLGLGWNSFKKLPVGIFAGLHNLQTLDLQSGTLKELPSGVFEDLSSLQMLDLRHTHRLNKLPVGVLAGLHNLQTLDLYNGGLWELPAGVFEDLYSLEMLNLKHNLNLDKLPVGVFAGLHNLRTLDLDGCRLKELPGGFFEDLHSLQALHLGELFDLKELPLGVFARLRNLQTLHLGEFDELPVDIFGGLRNLKTLSLRTNLNFLPVDIFAEQHNLEELQLSFYGTNLSKVPAKALNKLFAGLSKLKTLGLRFNRLGDLPAKALRNMFAELGNLQTLKLSYSNLGPKLKVWPSVLAGLSNLKVLDLEGNNLNQLPLQSWSTLFAQFKTLQTLNLERNNFTELPSFAQLRNLQELILNHNKLSDLPPGTFLGLSSLKVLKLEDNLLNKLPVAIFADLHNLQELVLDENKLSDLPAGIFEGLSHLKVLKLHYNKLNKLPVGIFAGLTNLQELSLWRNKLSELPVGIFAELHNLQILELFGNELAELDVGVFAGLTNLRGLYIHGNKLSELPVGVFEELHSLTFLQHDLRDVPAICSFIQCP